LQFVLVSVSATNDERMQFEARKKLVATELSGEAVKEDRK
jgi:hypothetical protein